MQAQQQEEIIKFKTIVDNIKTGVLFTHSNIDELKGRPMITMSIDSNCSLWFFGNEFSSSVHQIWRNNEVFVNYANPYINTYAVVKGKAYLTRDINKINDLYISTLNEWFPCGVNDPGLLLIRVEPVKVEYWNGNSGKIVSSYNIATGISVTE